MGICLACDAPSQLATFCTSCGKELQLQRRYVAETILGRGGFGRTYLATDEGKQRQPRCVIKQFICHDPNTKSKALELFHEEAVRLDDLGQHPQIPALLTHCQQDGRSYLVQEFIYGENLQQELKDRPEGFTEAEVRDILGQILIVLDYIHQQQVIHRDIKPENIRRRRSDRQLVLVGFGVAKYASATALAKTGTTISSTSYEAPEQGRGKAVFASDLYSLGITCLHLLTGVDPFTLDDQNLGFAWRDFLNGKSVSTEFGRVLDKLTQYLPADRYGNATEVLTALGKPRGSANPAPQQPINKPFSPIFPPTPKQPVFNTNYQSAPVTLKSAKGIDYRELEQLLKAQEWRKADELTAKLMCKVAGCEKEGFLDDQHIEAFPCDDLRTIDQLWVHYSNGKFGFSVQKKLWLECGGKIGKYGKYDYDVWGKFATKVGWYHPKNDDWRTYNEFMKDTQNAQKALPASLPAEVWLYDWYVVIPVGRWQSHSQLGIRLWYRSRYFILFSRAETCEL